MRLLYIHASRMSFEPVEEALPSPPDPASSLSVGECLVVFASVEEGDDESVVSRAVDDVVGHASRLGVDCILIYPYAHLSSRLAPPGVAHRLLELMEEEASRRFGGRVYRAPFGWYKRFSLDAKGHPLSELSRSFTSYSFPGDSWGSWLSSWGGDALETARLMGILGPTPYSLDAMTALALRIAGGGWRGYGVVEARGPRELLYRACSGGWSVVFGGGQPRIVVSSREGSTLEAVRSLIGSGVELRVDSQGFIRGVGGVVGLRVGGRECVGPLDGVYLEAISAGHGMARRGVTPSLAYWASPVQVAVIPAGEALEYASRIHGRLLSMGARSVILSGGSLGSRVRLAGRMWVPLVVVVGAREEESGTVSLRRRWRWGSQEVVGLDEFYEEVAGLGGRWGGARPDSYSLPSTT